METDACEALVRVTMDTLGWAPQQWRPSSPAGNAWQSMPTSWVAARGKMVDVLATEGTVRFKAYEDGLLSLTVAPAGLSLRSSLALLPAALLELSRTLGASLDAKWFGPVVKILEQRPYPRPQPPFHSLALPLGSTWWATDLRLFAKTRTTGIDWVERLEHAELPPQLRRTFDGPLVIYEWVTDTDDPVAYDRERGRLDAWLGDVVGLPLDNNFNELGDKLSALGARSSDPDLTYLASAVNIRHGSKALVPEASGRLDPADVTRLKGWLASGTPSGTALTALWVVVPTRDAALAVREQVLDAGLSGVLYVETGRGLMDPFPPGPWLHEVDPTYCRGVTDAWRRSYEAVTGEPWRIIG